MAYASFTQVFYCLQPKDSDTEFRISFPTWVMWHLFHGAFLQRSVQLGLSLTLASDSPRCLVTNHVFSYTTTPHLLPHFSDLPPLEDIGIAHRVQSKRARLCRCNIMVLTIHGIHGELPHVVICNVAEEQTGTPSQG